MRHWVLALAVIATATMATAAEPTERPRLFQPPVRPVVPSVKQGHWPRNPLDRFVLARLEAVGLSPSPEADRWRLLRRAHFVVTGLPPTLSEQRAFLADNRPDVYERLIDRLLASPHFGERWAQHWLDLVRYAESDGFNQDALRPLAYRYRDWVIAALNANLGYDRFVQWQLAGDELAADEPDALIAAGFNRLWPDEYNAANLEQRRQEILDDLTDTAGLAFLGLTVGCARCHDHKYDPISQKEYFALQSFFAPIQPRDLPAARSAEWAVYRQRHQQWEQASRDIRAEIDRLIGERQKTARDYTLTRFNDDIQKAVRTPPEKRTPLQWQIALMAQKQLDRAAAEVPNKLPAAEKKRYQQLQEQLARLGPEPTLPMAMTVNDIGPDAPPTRRLIGGDWRKPAGLVQPGFPEALGGGQPDTRLPAGVISTGRRAALARWLTKSDHPLTARVFVNRVWQHTFGVGLVATPNDFGVQGTPPSHPELLDWLACEFVASGWDIKHLLRLLLTSATFRQDSRVDPNNDGHSKALLADRENTLLWRANRRRLEGEVIRDSLLALSGELNTRMYGPSARPELPAALGKAAWAADPRPEDRQRRSVYVLVKRNLRYPFFEAFDQPDLHNSCGRRLCTTTAPQALLLFNSDLSLGRGRVWAESFAESSDSRATVRLAMQAAWGRPASADEIALGERFLERQAVLYRNQGSTAEQSRQQALVDFCHALLNTNEFLYID